MRQIDATQRVDAGYLDVKGISHVHHVGNLLHSFWREL